MEDSGYETSTNDEEVRVGGDSTSSSSSSSPHLPSSPHDPAAAAAKKQNRQSSGYVLVGEEAEEDGGSSKSSHPATDDDDDDNDDDAAAAPPRSRAESFVNIPMDEVAAIREQEYDDQLFARVTDSSLTGFGVEILRAAAAPVQQAGEEARERWTERQGVPTPEEAGCPCWNYPEEEWKGWRACPFKEHRIAEAIKRGLEPEAE